MDPGFVQEGLDRIPEGGEIMNPMKWPVWVRIAVVVSVWWEGLVFAFTLVSFYSLEGRGYAGFEIKDILLLWSIPVILFWGGTWIAYGIKLRHTRGKMAIEE